MVAFKPRVFAASLLVCAAGGALLSWLSGMPMWLAFSIVAVALIVNGVVAEVEDRSPSDAVDPKESAK
jgi:uncharacterized membrane protein